MNKKKSIIVGIIIFLIVIIVSILVVIKSTKNVENKEISTVSKSSLYEIDKYDNTYVYVNTEGKIVTMEGYSKIKNLKAGSSLARKEGEENYCVIDNKGNVIVPSDKYDSIDDTLTMFDSLTLNLNYFAEKQDKYALLNVEGKELTDFKYDNISSWMFNNYIYKIEVDEKYGVIANTGKVLLEPNYDKDSIKVYSSEGKKILVIKALEKCFVYNTEEFDLILEIDANEFSEDCSSYIFNKDNKTLYIIRDGKIKITLDNCDFESIGYKNDYYFTYRDTNYKDVIYNYDGTKIKGNLSDVILGKDFMYAEEDKNVYVYNNDKLVKTLKNYSIENSGVTNSDFVILKNKDDYYNIFDKKGELININNYYSSYSDVESNRTSYKLSGNIQQGIYSLKESGTNNCVALMPDGQIISSNNLAFESFLYDYDNDEYSNKYIIAKNIDSNHYCIVDKDGNVIHDTVEYSSSEHHDYMCSSLDYIIVHDTSAGKYKIYDYKNNKVVIESESRITYIKDYKIFKTNDKVYSLDGKVIYQIKK